jgi:hypothetical protein
MSGPEVERLAGAVWFMELHCQHHRRKRLWWATTDRGTPRSIIADIGKRITRQQRRNGLPAYSVAVFEASGGLHAHFVFIGTSEIKLHLKSSTAFGSIIKVEPVTDADSLARKYLAKERTPQAGYRRQHIFGGRLRGSHRLPGGGDKVRLSDDLKSSRIRRLQRQPSASCASQAGRSRRGRWRRAGEWLEAASHTRR